MASRTSSQKASAARRKVAASARLLRPGQPGGVRDTNRKEKAQAIRDAALLLFLERGIEGVSVDDIMKAAGMAKGSFYRYFDDQADLVASIMAPVVKTMTQVLESCSRDLETAGTRDAQFAAYRQIGEALVTLLLEYPGPCRLYLQESRAPAIGARVPIVELSRLVSRYAVEMTKKAQAHGILRPIPTPVSALTVVGATERLVLGVLTEEDIGNPLEVPDALTSLILDGLKGPNA